MAFSLLSFLGGAAGAGSQILDERREQKRRDAEYDKKTAEQQQWVIATETRKENREKRKEKRDREAELEELLEQASLYFDPKHIPLISSKGKSGLVAAIDHAKAMAPFNIRGSDLLNLNNINNTEDFPTEDELSQLPKKDSPFTTNMFSSIPTEPEKFTGSSIAGRLEFFTELARTSKTQDKRNYYNNLAVQTQKEIDASKEPSPTEKSNTARKLIESFIDDQFTNDGLIEVDPTTQYIRRTENNTLRATKLMTKAYSTIRNDPNFVADGSLDYQLKLKEAEAAAVINGFRSETLANYNNFLQAEQDLQNFTQGSDEYEQQQAKIENLKFDVDKTFIPLDTLKPLTLEQVNKGAWNTLDENKLVEVLKPDGTRGYVINTGSGPIRLGLK